MKKLKHAHILAIIVVILFFAIMGFRWSMPDYGHEDNVLPMQKCVELCENTELDLSSGPCLSDDNLEWIIPNYVCDVAHEPREEMDSLTENQCKGYLNGVANYFVEVTPECDPIV
ncbi:MAG: hypothetical protein ABIA56_01035 [Actinomycetota bacterium]